MRPPRTTLRTAVSVTAAVLLAGVLTGCAPDEASREVVAPIVLTEPGPGADRDPTRDVGAEPVPPTPLEPIGDDTVRPERDDTPDDTDGGAPASSYEDGDDAPVPATGAEPDDGADDAADVDDDGEDAADADDADDADDAEDADDADEDGDDGG